MGNDMRTYSAVTGAYWGLTVTDGALRMLVLLHFHTLGYSPLQLAYLFLLYEAMGIATNFFGGWIGAKFGLKITLHSGLAVQVVAMLMLSGLQDDWSQALSVAYVMACQALSGIAKDLTKMSSKSAVKSVVKDADASGSGTLFKLVALLTGSKNALKGVGFFIGGALLTALGFEGALWAMSAGLVIILLAVLVFVRGNLGKASTDVRLKDMFHAGQDVNILSFARVFLFAARDVWFVVALPIYLKGHLGWSFEYVSLFMACWVIAYGFVQSAVPMVTRQARDAATAGRTASVWGWFLAGLPVAIAAGMVGAGQINLPSEVILIGGLFVFGFLFAINSSLHSYLIVAFADGDKTSMAVGFYYMANAIGRFMGTLLSGLVYTFGGLDACLLVSSLLMVIAALSVGRLKDSQHPQKSI